MQEYVAKLEAALGETAEESSRTATGEGGPLRSEDALEEITRLLRGTEEDGG